ncbi:hypothetical protein KQI61_04245 [Anaerocolumna aminovalerica]|uniref:hypothetical protein n=1 Tax=Anaerocolumna aminovalerica TaxID=1527 RepID=UPI001C0ED3FA|nr:hypothetical protein [Anaerocolumna aminovalerica]MBU5331398.1 hypothetical protein [Anaerocolumna aminovalerica]
MIINTILILVCMILLAYHYSFEKPREDKKIFKLYNLRDELSHKLTNNNDLLEKEEYLFVLSLLEHEICIIQRGLRISELMNEENSNNEEELNRILVKIKEDNYLSNILVESNTIIKNHLKNRIFIFRTLILKPIIAVLSIWAKVLDNRNLSKKEIKQKKRKIYKYRDYFTEIPEVFNVYRKCV